MVIISSRLVFAYVIEFHFIIIIITLITNATYPIYVGMISF